MISLKIKILEGLSKVGFPRTDTRVIDIEGHLTAGHSGAPLLNSDMELVGIGSGGLMHGKIERAWAIPASRLSELRVSNDQFIDQKDIWDIVEGQFVVTEEQAIMRLTPGFSINDMKINTSFSFPGSNIKFARFSTDLKSKLAPMTKKSFEEISLPDGISSICCARKSISWDSRGTAKAVVLTASGFRIYERATLFPKYEDQPLVAGFVRNTCLMIAFYRRPISNPQICFTRQGRGRDYDLLLLCSGGQRLIIYDDFNSQVYIQILGIEPSIGPNGKKNKKDITLSC